MPFLFLVLIKRMWGWFEPTISQRRCSTKKAVLKNFAMFTRKHLLWSLFLIKVQTFRPANLLKWTPTQTFCCEYCEIFKSTYFKKHLWTAASMSQRVNLGKLSSSWVNPEVESFSTDLLEALRCNLVCVED